MGWLILLFSAVSSASFAEKGNWGLYGTDDRVEFTSASPLWQAFGAATAVQVDQADLEERTGNYYLPLDTPSFGETQDLCTGERFAEQPSWGGCSAFWVGGKQLVTAGHCVESELQCQTARWVFDFALDASGVARRNFSADQVYRCAKIIVSQNMPIDFAVLELDREPVGRVPLKIRQTGKLSVSDPVAMWSYPSGLPLKLSGPALVAEFADPSVFRVPLDHLGGSSGAPVFNYVSGEVEGVLVAGFADFSSVSLPDSGETCHIHHVHSPTGSDDFAFVTEIAALLPYIKF